MSRYDDQLLSAAQRLVARRTGQRGKLSGARVRRSISTCYYAMFHFLTEEAGTRLLGSAHDLRQRRRVLARAFTHRGIKVALDKMRGATVDRSVDDFFRPPGSGPGPVAAPPFVQEMAKVFADVQAKRHDADYDLNKVLSATEHACSASGSDARSKAGAPRRLRGIGISSTCCARRCCSRAAFARTTDRSIPPGA